MESNPAALEAKPTGAANETEVQPPPKPRPEEVARGVLDSRSVRVFRPSQERFDPHRVELPDDFYEPSVEELSQVMKSMTSDVRRMADAPLMTKKMRDARAAKRMSKFRKVFIRVLLPDRVALQGVFEPQSTVRQVQRFVRAALKDARNVRFHMFVVPPKMKLTNLDVTLWSQGFVPAALIHLAIEEGPTESQLLLKEYLLDQIEDTPRPILPAPIAPPVPERRPQPPPATTPKKSSGKKIPKWFKSK